VQRGDEANRGTRVLPGRCLGGETVEGSSAAVAFVGTGISQGAEVGEDDCGPGGGGAVPTQGGDVVLRGQLFPLCLKSRTPFIPRMHDGGFASHAYVRRKSIRVDPRPNALAPLDLL
jgi:hypothetical protein